MHKINEQDIQTYLDGNCDYAHHFLGAHLIKNDEHQVIATSFTVYAPHAKEVRLIAEFNQFEGWKHVLTKIHPQGFYRIEIPGNYEWSTYKYEIHTLDHKVLYKADPFGYFAEERPANGSKVYHIDGYHWHDDKWHAEKKKPYEEPLLIYEVHLGSWRRTYGMFKKYNEVVDELAAYVLAHGFTHVELMPIYEYPLDDSWGYQGTGFFAATSRYGVPQDLMYFIDKMHACGIGVIIDWVLGHICKDAHGLSYFDGTPLYEYHDKKRRENVVWGTNNLDFSKGITRSFMRSALTFWVDYFHIDGFRIDAVSNLIYYLGDARMGENKEAIRFIKDVSRHLYAKDDRILFMAEDSTDYPKVTHPLDAGGMGFNYKWNMGFMNDILSYFKEDPVYRKYHHDKVTFGLIYAFNEQFVCPFSHDEVVHMKGSLLSRMPGDSFQKFANWRLLMTLWMTHPGKKLLFMGQEFAQFSEWSFQTELDWYVLEQPAHQKANRFFKDLAKVYRHHEALYTKDHKQDGFQWLVPDDKNQSVFAYVRYGHDETIIVILNMTPNVHEHYDIPVPQYGYYEEILNSDKAIYNGSDQYNGKTLRAIKGECLGFKHYIKPKLGPLAGMILRLKK